VALKKVLFENLLKTLYLTALPALSLPAKTSVIGSESITMSPPEVVVPASLQMAYSLEQ